MYIGITLNQSQTLNQRFRHLSGKTNEKINDRSLKNGDFSQILLPGKIQLLAGSRPKKDPFYTGNG